MLLFLSGCNTSLIEGTLNNDKLIGTDKSDVILAGDGNDSIEGGPGNDILDGGPDIDTVSYAEASVAIIVDLREESEQVSSGTYIDTLIGIENIIGSNFNDVITDGVADNEITGGLGCDLFQIAQGSNTITDLHSCDVFVVEEGAMLNAIVKAEFIASPETVVVGTVRLLAETASSVIDMRNASSGEFIIIGGEGNDVLAGGIFNDTLTGGEGSDVFIISSGTDYISDLNTGDSLQVSVNAVVAAVNVSNFIADNATRNDGVAMLLSSQSGSIIDMSLSEFGDYILIGSSGVDIFTGGHGNDTLTGDASPSFKSKKFLALDSNNSGNTFNITFGTDTITDLSTGDILVVSSGATANGTNISNFVATNSTTNGGVANLTAGDTGSTIILTNSLSGFYTITGGSGIDNLTGGSGDDIIDGAGGNDNLIGGDGNDTFNITAGTDIISDITTGDILVVSSGATANGMNISNFVATSSTINAGIATLTAGNSGSTITLTNSVSGAYTLNGGSGIDILTGDTDADTLVGNEGDDVLDGAGGTDTLTGGSNNDTFKVTSGTDSITDLSTGDILIVSASATANATSISNFVATSSTINGGTANLTAGNSGSTITMTNSVSGAYTLTGGLGVDILTGDTDADTLVGNDGDDVLDGGGGADIITGGTGADSLIGGDGNDVFKFNTNDIAVSESITELNGEGSDAVSILTTTDFTNMTANSFNEIEEIRFEGRNQEGTFTSVQLESEVINFTETGGSGTSKVIINLVTVGETAVFSNLAATTFTSGSDTITINGLSGDENITGPDLASSIYGSSGNDTITGGNANDIIDGGDDNDIMDGGAGTNTLSYVTASAAVTVDLSNGAQQNTIGSGLDTLSNFDKVTGSDHDDTLTGNDNANLIGGKNGDDTILGGGGDDTLRGNAGNDNIDGGLGNDQLTGDSDDDTFNITSGVDSVTDLTTGDILIISSGATVNAANISTFVATNSTSNGGTANLTAGNSGSTITLTNSTSGFYTVTGGSGVDNLTGGSGNDIIDGLGGDDILYGGTGGDTLTGGSTGVDIIDVGLGDGSVDNVNLTGVVSFSNRDNIYSFNAGEDIVRIVNTSLTGSATAGGEITVGGTADATKIYIDSISNLGSSGINIGDQSVTYTSGGYAYASDTGALFYDADGDWSAGSIQVAAVYSTAYLGADTAANLGFADFQFG